VTSPQTDSWRFNPPPGWPPTPDGWQPPERWTPDPTWPTAPPDWEWWLAVETTPRRRWLGSTWLVVAALVLFFPLGLVLVWTTSHWHRRGRWTATMLTIVAVVAISVTNPPAPQLPPDSTAASRPTSSASETPSGSPDASVSPSPSNPPATVSRSPQAGTALAALARLRVAGRGPMTGYSREAFGPAWTDTNRNGCDTRNDILGRDLIAKTYKAGTHGCLILSGTLLDPYTASDILFVRGGASEVDIDHVVALGNAWVSGASRWPYAERIAFANDPLALLAVQASANRQKGDGDAATWLPSNKAYRCAYVARQVSVKIKFGLTLTPAEHDAIARTLGTCPGQPLLTGGNPILSSVTPSATTPKATSSPKPTTPGGGSVYYANCTAARAAGAAPLYAGKPGYRTGLDRDHDGIACE